MLFQFCLRRVVSRASYPAVTVLSESSKMKKSTLPSANSVTRTTKRAQKREHLTVEYDLDASQCKTSKSEEKPDTAEPMKWTETLKNIREMRKNGDAPVDGMGCDKCSDEKASPEVVRYQVLISLMLSSQTKDTVTFSAMQRLKSHGLNIENILNTADKTLGELIYPVGFWKTKVQRIKETTQILKDKFSGDIPASVEELCSLPGVGPKMAHLCMRSAWGEVTGIGVDTHVHRIANRLHWVGKKGTKTPEQTRKALEAWLPFSLWEEVNHLLVGFGQTICRPVNPLCDSCLNKPICPSAGIKSERKSKHSLK